MSVFLVDWLFGSPEEDDHLFKTSFTGMYISKDASLHCKMVVVMGLISPEIKKMARPHQK